MEIPLSVVKSQSGVKAPSFEIGALVKLNSGSPDLKITGFSKSGGVEVSWSGGASTIPAACLSPL
jgi:uncharacterized protein YodC (DUF2158 family)